MKNVKLLVGLYLAIGVVTLVVVWFLRNDHAAVTDAVWVRGTLVVLSAALLYLFSVRADRGSRGAYRRLRIIAPVLVVAVAVIVALPGTFPVWMKVDQVAVGLVLLGVTVAVNRHELRTRFAAK